jgi:putative ABC transport system permease protein
MFWRLLWKLLRGSGGRLTVAILALVSCAMVVSALLNLEFDIERKLTQEFRTLGANLLISPRNAQITGSSPAEVMSESDVSAAIQSVKDPNVAAAAPFLYVVGSARNTPLVIAGTHLEELPKLEPAWRIEGAWKPSKAQQTACLVGRNVAQQLKLAVSSSLNLI